MPPIAGTKSGVCLVVSSGRSVWDDLLLAGYETTKWQQDACVIAVNDVGMHLPCKIDHWFSNDTRWLPKWFEARRPSLQKMDERIYTHTCAIRGITDYFWPWPGNGTSSMGAVLTALAMGYDEIKVCGVPMDDSGHYFDPPWVKTSFHRSGSVRFWERAIRELFCGKVNIMSGNLKEIINASHN